MILDLCWPLRPIGSWLLQQQTPLQLYRLLKIKVARLLFCRVSTLFFLRAYFFFQNFFYSSACCNEAWPQNCSRGSVCSQQLQQQQYKGQTGGTSKEDWLVFGILAVMTVIFIEHCVNKTIKMEWKKRRKPSEKSQWKSSEKINEKVIKIRIFFVLKLSQKTRERTTKRGTELTHIQV